MFYCITTVICILLIDNIFAAQLLDLWADYNLEDGDLAGRISIQSFKVK